MKIIEEKKKKHTLKHSHNIWMDALFDLTKIKIYRIDFLGVTNEYFNDRSMTRNKKIHNIEQNNENKIHMQK